VFLDYKPLESITEDDLQALIINAVAEAKTVEYKAELPGTAQSAKKEFLADISSFSNASGGHIIYGVAADHGIPTQLSGLDIANPDGEVLRLESMIRDGIRPRVPVSIHTISLQTQKTVLIVRLPRGFATPHQVTLEQDYRFYSRSSNGKYRLDVDELRIAFALGADLGERIRLFRADRLTQIVADETPVRVANTPKIVLHLIPLTAFDPQNRVDVGILTQAIQLSRVLPISNIVGGISYRRNFDGFLCYAPVGTDARSSGYVQVFQNGIIEAVDAYLIWPRGQGLSAQWNSITAEEYERYLIQALPRYLSVQKELNVSAPILLMLSFIGVKDYLIGFRRRPRTASVENAIDRDVLVIPAQQIDGFDVDAASVLRPVFDQVANAGGWERSLSYDETGKWIG